MCSSNSEGALTRLQGALSELSGEDLKPMFGPQVLERTARLVAAKNMIDAELARTAHEGELTQAPEHDGLTSMRSWLGGHQRLAPATAARLVRIGPAPPHPPAVAPPPRAGAIPPH